MANKGIKVSFNPGKFEDAIERHGQYLRWYTSTKCYCITRNSPNPSCNICLGRGEIYSGVQSITRLFQAFSWGGKIIVLNKNLNKVFRVRSKSREYAIDSFTTAGVITLIEDVPKGEYLYIDCEESLLYDYVGPCSYQDKGIIKILIPSISDVQGTFFGTVTKITKLRNVTKSQNIKIESFWENLIYTKDPIDSGDSIEIECKYIKPVKMLIVNNLFKESRDKPIPFPEADATITFSGFSTIGKGDIFTQLRAEQRVSFVGIMNDTDTYKTSFFHVKSIISIIDSRGTIEDAIIVRNNEIFFPTRKPIGNFSVSLTYYPTYIVSDLPRLRYAEDKVFPKIAPLKLYSMTNIAEARPIQNQAFERGFL